mgnify:CR=1 FL=1
MEPEARYTMIGAFVVALMLALAIALVWVSGAGSGSDFHRYLIVFEKQSLEGLQVGSDVNMRGVKVGRVENFGIDRDNINKVSVEVRVDRRTPVSTNSEAIINRNLVTGLARIDLNTPGEPGPELDPSADDGLPVIAEGRADLDEITETASSLVASARQGLDSINALLSADNRKAMTDILLALRTTTASLDERVAGFAQTATDLSDTARRIGDSFVEIGQEVKPLTVEARKSLAQMRGALRDITKAVNQMQANTSALANRAGNAADVGVSELQATAREFRSGVDILSRTLDRLQDPRSALLGPGKGQLGPGEGGQ